MASLDFIVIQLEAVLSFTGAWCSLVSFPYSKCEIICIQHRQIAQRASVSSTETVCRAEWNKVVKRALEPSSPSVTLTDATDRCRWALTAA